MLQRWLSFWKVLPSPQRNYRALQSDHRVLGQLPDQGPSPPIAHFGRAASSRKNLGGSKLLPFKNDGVLCVLRDPSPDLCLDIILSRSSTDNSFDLMAVIVFALTCTVGPYIDRCVPFQIMSNRLNLPQVDYNQAVEHLKDDQWKQDAPELNFKSHSKGFEYLCK